MRSALRTGGEGRPLTRLEQHLPAPGAEQHGRRRGRAPAGGQDDVGLVAERLAERVAVDAAQRQVGEENGERHARPAEQACAAAAYSPMRTRSSTQIALKPSRQVIFLPSAYVRP